MNSKKKLLLIALGLIAVLAMAGVGYRSLSSGYDPVNPAATSESSSTSAQQPIPAPDFTVLDWEGNEVSLSDFFGKPMVLNFWATWCGPCQSELPDFDQVWSERGDEVTFMMIDLTDGQRDTVEGVKAYVEEEGFGFPVYFDTELEAAYAYGASSIPLTMFIDADGYVLGGYRGPVPAETLEEVIDWMLEG